MEESADAAASAAGKEEAAADDTGPDKADESEAEPNGTESVEEAPTNAFCSGAGCDGSAEAGGAAGIATDGAIGCCWADRWSVGIAAAAERSEWKPAGEELLSGEDDTEASGVAGSAPCCDRICPPFGVPRPCPPRNRGMRVVKHFVTSLKWEKA